MSDPAHDETEKIIRALEIRVNNEYTQAEKEVQAKLDDYLKRFKKKDETWRKWVNDVKKSEPEEYKKRLEDYKKWKTSQIAVGKRWQEMKQTLAEDLHNANLIARSIATGYMPEIYALNHDYGTYTVESGAMKDTSYTLYDKSTVEYLMRDNPQLLPDPGKDLTRRIYGMLDVRWNRQQLQSVMIQAILQGESIADIATRLANTVGEKNRKAAIRNARTMATGAQNAGRIDSYKRAERLGIKMKQQWLSTHDNRTRHSHRQTDYEIQPVGEKFSNGCRFPGDPEAPAQEVYNCRCTLRGLVDGLEPKARELRDLSEIGDYEEWKKSKKSVSNPIDLPEKKAAAIKGAYIAEYRRKAASLNNKTNYAKSIDRFYVPTDDTPVIYTPEMILAEMSTTEVGRTAIRHIRDNYERIYIVDAPPGVTDRGEQCGSEIKLYQNNIKDINEAARTMIHEDAHYSYQIGKCQHAEAVCFAMEKMHLMNRNYLTENEWHDIIDLARNNYPELAWEVGGYGDFSQFNFVRKTSKFWGES